MAAVSLGLGLHVHAKIKHWLKESPCDSISYGKIKTSWNWEVFFRGTYSVSIFYIHMYKPETVWAEYDGHFKSKDR